MASMTVRFAICGSAYWAEEVHLPALADVPGIELVGVFARRPERAMALAAKFDIAPFSDFEALLESCDAVSFAVPPDAQAGLARRAVARGRHVLLEKPVAGSLADALALCRAIDAAGVASICFLTRLFIPQVQALIAEARRREAISGSAMFRSGALLPGTPYAGSAWRQSEFGALWDAVPHPLTVMAAVLGPVVRVIATRADSGAVRLELEHAGGRRSQISIDLRDPAGGLVEDYAFDGGRGGRIELNSPPYVRRAAFAAAAQELLARIDAPRHSAAVDLGFAIAIVALLDAAERSLRAGGEPAELQSGLETAATPDVTH
jgi:predicted dehydrogenase